MTKMPKQKKQSLDIREVYINVVLKKGGGARWTGHIILVGGKAIRDFGHAKDFDDAMKRAKKWVSDVSQAD